MDERLRNFYMESRVKNASPGAVLVMLYDTLVEQAEAAEIQIAAGEGTKERLLASQSIRCCMGVLTELRAALRTEVDPELCATLANLYRFFAGEFYGALTKSNPKRIKAILPLLRDLRETWTQAHRISSQAAMADQVQVLAA